MEDVLGRGRVVGARARLFNPSSRPRPSPTLTCSHPSSDSDSWGWGSGRGVGGGGRAFERARAPRWPRAARARRREPGAQPPPARHRARRVDARRHGWASATGGRGTAAPHGRGQPCALGAGFWGAERCAGAGRRRTRASARLTRQCAGARRRACRAPPGAPRALACRARPRAPERSPTPPALPKHSCSPRPREPWLRGWRPRAGGACPRGPTRPRPRPRPRPREQRDARRCAVKWC